MHLVVSVIMISNCNFFNIHVIRIITFSLNYEKYLICGANLQVLYNICKLYEVKLYKCLYTRKVQY